MGRRVARIVPLGVLLGVFMPLGATGATPAYSVGGEGDFATFEISARSRGALGFFTDESGAFVVVVSAADAATYALPDASQLAAPVRLAATEINGQTIHEIEDRLEHMWSDASYDGGSYAYYFDPRTGRVQVIGGGPSDTVVAYLGNLANNITYTKLQLHA